MGARIRAGEGRAIFPGVIKIGYLRSKISELGNVTRTPYLQALHPFPRILFSALLIIGSLFVFFLVGIFLAMPLFGISFTQVMAFLVDYSDPGAIGLLKYLQIIQEVGIFIAPPLIAAFLFSSRPFTYLGLDRVSHVKMWGLTILIMVASVPAISQLIELNEAMKLPGWLAGMEEWMQKAEEQAQQLTEVFLKVDTVGGFLFNLLMIAILPAIGEELLFRGLFRRLFHEWWGNIHIAIFLAALLFGVMHLQFYGLLPRTLLGLLFGYLFYWSGSLWIPIFAHFLNNAVAVTVAFLERQGMIGTGMQDFGNTDNLFVNLSSVVVTLMLLYLFRRLSSSGKG